MAKENKTNRGGIRQGAGRKRDGDELRDIRVMARITKSENEKLQQKASSKNETVSNYLCSLIKKDLEK